MLSVYIFDILHVYTYFMQNLYGNIKIITDYE